MSEFLLSNDDWPIGGSDDLQTFAVHMSIDGIGKGRVTALTDKYGNRRTDELVLAYAIPPEICPDFHIGLIVTGNLGGQAIQSKWHTIVGEPRVELPYERYDIRPIGLYSHEWEHVFVDTQYWLDGGRAIGGLCARKPDGIIKIGITAHIGNQLSDTAKHWQSNGIFFLEFRTAVAGKVPAFIRIEQDQTVGGFGYVF